MRNEQEDAALDFSTAARDWRLVRRNPTFQPGSLTDDEAGAIKWHSPADPCSSQIFCVSAFGGLRRLPDCDEVLSCLFAAALPAGARSGPWELHFEFANKAALGETGLGTPTSIDVFCKSPQAAVCIESKFLFDAQEGFGSCGQVANGDCAGYHGPGSDRKNRTSANCRLTVSDGRRGARKYWELGRRYFLDDVHREQASGEACPFASANFQLMRNFLFAASFAPSNAFGVLAIVPTKTGAKIERQVVAFRDTVLRVEFRPCIAITSYDRLVDLLAESRHEQSRDLARFLKERMATLL